VFVVSFVLYVALLIVFFAMWARFVFDWVQALNRSWRPRGLVVLAAEVSYTLTDPPIRAVRKVVPPIRLGAIQLDLAWTIVMVVLFMLMSLVGPR
jgi:YggT family protein